jgi:hypothetical protein
MRRTIDSIPPKEPECLRDLVLVSQSKTKSSSALLLCLSLFRQGEG